MYISRRLTLDGYEYSLNESYYDPPYYRSRVIYKLGTHPEKFIEYYSEVAFYITIEEDLKNLGIKTDQFELEELFFRFLTPEAQQCILSPFNRKRREPFPKTNIKKLDMDQIHPFDALRYIALKFGILNPQKYINQPFPFLKNLMNKSRDEIENYLWDKEDKLKFRERFKYFQAIFKLAFVEDPKKNEEMFLEKICKLAKNEKYRMGLSEEEVISRYLARYIWYYYDTFLKIFTSRPQPKIYHESDIMYKIAEVLNVSVDFVKNSSKEKILKMFRQKLKEVHPDKGGKHEEFIKIRKLMETYSKLFH